MSDAKAKRDIEQSKMFYQRRIQQLNREKDIPRMKVSEAVADLVRYTEEYRFEDPLITPDRNNPFLANNMLRRVIPRIPKQFASCSSRAVRSSAVASSTSVVSVPNKEVLQKATVHPAILKPFLSTELQNEDHFKMSDCVDVEEMFDARIHYGHKIGTLNDNMKWALFGQRLDYCVFDLDITKQYMVKALNFLAHISNRSGMVLFVTSDRTNMLMVERMAADMGQYSHTRKWQEGTLTNTRQLFGSPVRLPDCIIFLSTLTSVLERHPAVVEAAKMAIPTIGIVDSNADPNYITYPIPGNDDSTASISYYMRMFAEAINRGKNAREGIDAVPVEESPVAPDVPQEHANLIDLCQPIFGAMDQNLSENDRLKFKEMYDKLSATIEFKDLVAERPHLAYPRVIQLIQQIHSAPSAADKLPLYDELCSTVFVKSDSVDFERANVYFFQAIEKDLNILGEVLARSKAYRNQIATAVVEGIMRSKEDRLEQLLDLMEGHLNPDNNIRIISARVSHELVKLLRANDVTTTTLKLASKIVAATFIDDDSAQRPLYGNGFKVVSKIMLTPSRGTTGTDNRISELVDMWAEDPRVSLLPDEVSLLEKQLSENNLQSRIPLVKLLKRKSKTVIRWMETEDIEKLEQEAEALAQPERKTKNGVLARLYSIIISKRGSETPRNLLAIAKAAQAMFSLKQSASDNFELPRSRFIGILSSSFNEALQDTTSDVSDEFWKIPFNYPGAYGFLYALNLCYRGKDDVAKDVLEHMKVKHDKTVFTGALNRICDAASEIPEKTLVEFVNMLSETFVIPLHQRRRIIQSGKTHSLAQLLKEEKLEEAFELCRSETEQSKTMFGQYHMLHAFIEADDRALIQKVFTLTEKTHDRNTAFIDLAIVLLEKDLDSEAKKIFERHNVYLSAPKLNYIAMRESKMNRPDVMHKLFDLVACDESRAWSVDVGAIIVPRLISAYESQENLEGLKRLQAEIKRVSFIMDNKLKSSLEKAIHDLEKRAHALPKRNSSPSDSADS